MKNFPKSLLIHREEDKDDTFFLVSETPDDIPEDVSGEKVGIYQLVGVKTFIVKKTAEVK